MCDGAAMDAQHMFFKAMCDIFWLATLLLAVMEHVGYLSDFSS